MPIYAYKCSSCGFAKDALQKMSDAPLTVCPSCGKATFAKQVTAAGFQLKGSGWYVTDFRDGNKGGAAAKDKPADSGDSAAQNDAKSDAKSDAKGDAAAPAASPSTDSASASAPASGAAAAPAPATGGGASGD